jgi:hypothetical protein
VITCDFSLISANKIKSVIKQIRTTQINKLNEQGVHHDDIPDDETLQQIDEYLEHLESVIPMEEANIQFARHTSLALRNTKLPYDIVGKIQSMDTVKEGQKKTRKSRKSRKTRKSRKSRKTRNTRKTRKTRNTRKHRRR